MKRFFLSTITALIFLLSGFPVRESSQNAWVQARVQTDSRLFPIADVRPGMKGIGRTIFQGTQIEEFGVEVLGMLDGVFNPKQKLVIARLSGPKVEKTGVFKGISGSPVFIDGKLLGSVSYGFSFSKEPIAGITPIEEMVAMFSQQPAESSRQAQPRRYSFAEMAGLSSPEASTLAEMLRARVGTENAVNPFLAPLVGQELRPIATPLVLGGIEPRALSQFLPGLQASGLFPVTGVSGTSPIEGMQPSTSTTLIPGSSVAVQLVRGDYTFEASGTVTWRDGDRIYAFGHPFISVGTASLPMSESSVITVIPNTADSFKLASSTRLVGSISQDRSTGVYGTLGVPPKMIPVQIKVRTSNGEDKVYHYEVVSDRFLTPVLMNVTVFNTIISTERSFGDLTLDLHGTISLKGQEPVRVDSRFSSNANVPAFATLALTQPVGLLLNSGFDDLSVEGIDVNIESSDVRSTATLEQVWVSRTEVRRGQKLDVQLFARADDGRQFVERVPVQIPNDATPGTLNLVVSDGATLNSIEARTLAPVFFEPKNLAQLVKAINKRRKNDRLYVKLLRSDDGAVINNEELPSLPPSVRATLNSERTSGGYIPVTVSSALEIELPPAKFVISGLRNISIRVLP